MAKPIFVAMTGTTEVATGTAKNVLEVRAGGATAARPVKVLGWGIYFDGTSVAAEPVQVFLESGDTSGGGGTSLSATPAAAGSICLTNLAATAIQSSAAVGMTAAVSTNVIRHDGAAVHPQSGYEVRYPLGQEPIIAQGKYVSIYVSAPATVNATAKMICEE
jgi:hypothetical protein